MFDKLLCVGSIFDLGCYQLIFLMLFAKDPKKIIIKSKKLDYAKSNVDNDARADLDCDNKFKAKIHVSIKDNLDNICIIINSRFCII